MNVLEENIGVNHCDLELGNCFLAIHQKHKQLKGKKIEKLDFID